MAFSEKTLDDRSIGDLLRAKREERGETLKDVEKAIRVSKKYITALEANDFDRLPEMIYAKNFVKALARHYGLDEDVLAESLVREMEAITGIKETERIPTGHHLRKKLVATPLVIKSGVVAVLFVAVLSYFAFSVHSILKPPKLIVFSPQDSQVYNDQRVVLTGETEPEVELTVNQEGVLIETDGTFSETLNLPEGVSILRVAAKKKHSKEQEVYIKVVIEAQDEGAAEEDQTVARK